jgi:hypothetical protein
MPEIIRFLNIEYKWVIPATLADFWAQCTVYGNSQKRQQHHKCSQAERRHCQMTKIGAKNHLHRESFCIRTLVHPQTNKDKKGQVFFL